MGGYIPSVKVEREQMLAQIGLDRFSDLFAVIPDGLRLKRPLNLPYGKSELEVFSQMERLGEKNKVFPAVFRGAGAYRHFIPSIVNAVTSAEDFVTAYTPYQPEISQGILQSIFEFQTMIADLCAMDVANASVYDGAAAAGEAVIMCKERGKTKVLVSEGSNPQVLAVLKTYAAMSGLAVQTVGLNAYKTDVKALEAALKDDVACVYIQQPNFYGVIEDAAAIGELVAASKAKYVMGVNPISLALLKTPGECQADIAVGEGQPLGIPLSFGGPYLGLMACKKELSRKLPGRIVGQTEDRNGKRGFVLTLQAREQHIRREKASSSICSNEALCAMKAAVYLGAMGSEGLREVADQCMAKAHYLARRLEELDGFSLASSEPFFHEFVTNSKIEPHTLARKLAERGILGGLPLEGKDRGKILWCATETNTKEQIDQMIETIREVIA